MAFSRQDPGSDADVLKFLARWCGNFVSFDFHSIKVLRVFSTCCNNVPLNSEAVHVIYKRCVSVLSLELAVLSITLCLSHDSIHDNEATGYRLSTSS